MLPCPSNPGEMKRVLLCGATGLVGRECLRLLLADPAFERVVVLTRRALTSDMTSGVDAAKLDVHVIDFDHLSAHVDLFRVDQILCALGTTIKQAGSRERFRQIDLGYPSAIARMGIEQGAKHFLLVSAVGASARSRVFYNRVKGELEEAVFALPYRSTTVVRPSLLVGERSPSRLGEEIAKRLSFLMPAKYKPVSAVTVATALIEMAKADQPGRRLLESAEIPSVAKVYRSTPAA